MIPILITLVLSAFWFWPARNTLPGWGEDPYFVLGVFEHLWSKIGSGDFDSLGSLPIFWPLDQSLFLSENFLIPGFLSYPIFLLMGDGARTLCLLAWGIQIANFSFMWAWLRSLGFQKSAAWGAMLFATSPWLQEHYAHYQNLFIFVIPLALWRVRTWVLNPTPKNFILAILTSGWGAWWNLYFQIFIQVLLAIYLVWTGRQKRLSWVWIGAFLFALGSLEFLLLKPYLDINQFLGGFSVTRGEIQNYSAHWSSFLAHAKQMSLIEMLPFYPSRSTSIESVGFVGWVAMGCLFFSFFRMIRSRVNKWAVLGAFLAYGVSLGPATPLHSLFSIFPGFGALRAIGRAQVVFVFFLIPLLLDLGRELFKRKPRWAIILSAFFFLEWMPARGGLVVPLEDAPATLDEILKSNSEPWVIESTQFGSIQREWCRRGIPLANGYSGRSPISIQLFQQAIQKEGSWEKFFEASDLFLEANRILIERRDWLQAAQVDPKVNPLGCFYWMGREHCAFERKVKQTSSFVRIDQSPSEKIISKSEETFVFRAKNNGTLSVQSVWGCVLGESYRLFGNKVYAKRSALNPWGFELGSFDPGEPVLRVARVRPLILRGQWLQRDLRLECHQEE